jgi:hypothetical protein
VPQLLKTCIQALHAVLLIFLCVAIHRIFKTLQKLIINNYQLFKYGDNLLKSPFLLAFVFALVNIYLLANLKMRLIYKFLAAFPLALTVGLLGAIAYTPDSLDLLVAVQVGFLNFILTIFFYVFLAEKFVKKPKTQQEREEEKKWIDKNFNKKK